jgi:hypothetical protein
MGDEEAGGSGKGAVSVTNDDSLTPTQRFARALQRRDALIRDRERRDAAAEKDKKPPRVTNPVPAE